MSVLDVVWGIVIASFFFLMLSKIVEFKKTAGVSGAVFGISLVMFILISVYFLLRVHTVCGHCKVAGIQTESKVMWVNEENKRYEEIKDCLGRCCKEEKEQVQEVYREEVLKEITEEEKKQIQEVYREEVLKEIIEEERERLIQEHMQEHTHEHMVDHMRKHE